MAIDVNKLYNIIRPDEHDLALENSGILFHELKVGKNDIIDVYRAIFEKFFDNIKIKCEPNLQQILDIAVDQKFDDEIFKKLIRITFQGHLESEKQNNWKVDNFTKKTLRYLVDLCLYCATDYSPKGINDFFKDMFESCEDFDAILQEVYTSYSTNSNKNNPEFLTPPLYIEEMVFDENLNIFKATRVSSLDTLFTILRNDKHILHLRSYTGERPGELTTNRKNREIDVDDLTQSSSTPTNLVLLEDRPAQIPNEDIIKLTEFVSNQNPELAIFLKEIGGKGFSDLLDDFFDGRLSFLTEDASFSSQLANLSSEFEQLKTKRKEIVCTPLVYGFTIFSILPKIIELSQNIVTSLKNKIKYSENTWIEDPEVLSKLVKALSPQVNSILKKINTDEESLSVFDQVLAGLA